MAGARLSIPASPISCLSQIACAATAISIPITFCALSKTMAAVLAEVVYTKEKYDNYKLHVEWRWPNGDQNANSGIFLLIADPKNPFPNGIECNLMLGNAGDFVLLGGSDLMQYQGKPGEPRPGFPVVKKNAPSSEKPAGEWNEANIYVKDGKINVYINGVYQNTGWNKQKDGYIGLQSEGKEVEFRNVTITPW